MNCPRKNISCKILSYAFNVFTFLLFSLLFFKVFSTPVFAGLCLTDSNCGECEVCDLVLCAAIANCEQKKCFGYDMCWLKPNCTGHECKFFDICEYVDEYCSYSCGAGCKSNANCTAQPGGTCSGCVCVYPSAPQCSSERCDLCTSCGSCIAQPACGWTGSSCQAGTVSCPAGYTYWYWHNCSTNECVPTCSSSNCGACTNCTDCTNQLSCGWNGSSCQAGTVSCPAGYTYWYWHNCSQNECCVANYGQECGTYGCCSPSNIESECYKKIDCAGNCVYAGYRNEGQYCGNNACSCNETCSNCSADCGCCSHSFVSGSTSPSSVARGSTFTVKCNYGAQVDCIWPSTGAGSCSWAGWSGNDATFSCTASNVGTFTTQCIMGAGTSSNCCARTDNDGSITVTPACVAPTLSAKGVSQTQIDLNWNAVSGATSYRGSYWNGLAWVELFSNTGNLYYSHTGLTCGTAISYWVKTNCGSSVSGESNWAVGTTFACAGATPTPTPTPTPTTAPGVTPTPTPTGGAACPAPTIWAQLITSNKITIAWNAVPGASYYRGVYWTEGLGGWADLPGMGLADSYNSTSYSHTGLSSCTTYFYLVYAVCGAQPSNWSNQLEATTLGCAVSPTPTPTGVATPTPTKTPTPTPTPTHTPDTRIRGSVYEDPTGNCFGGLTKVAWSDSVMKLDGSSQDSLSDGEFLFTNVSASSHSLWIHTPAGSPPGTLPSGYSCSSGFMCFQNTCPGDATVFRGQTYNFWVTPYEAAWFQTKGGDVGAQGDIKSEIPASSLSFSQDKDGYPGVVAYKEGSSADFGQGSVSRIPPFGWLAESGYSGRTYNYAFFAERIGSTQELTSTEISYLTDLPSGFYKVNGDLTLPTPAGSNWTIGKAPGQQIVILVDGNLTIKGQVSIQGSQPNFIAFIVSGNILLSTEGMASGETQQKVEGVYIANGTISTNKSDKQLKARGVFVGWSGFSLKRDLGETNKTTPAEFFEYDINLLMKAPREVMHRPFVWEEIAP